MPLVAIAIETQPWFGDVYEFHFLGAYSYSEFHKVANAKPPYNQPFHENLIYSGLDFAFTPQWAVDADLQVAETTKQSFNFRTAAIQLRYLWLDDVIGDAVSLATGASGRFTPSYALRDVSCPSHAPLDFEVNFSVGKEWEATHDWLFRFWGYGAIGHAIRGSPWVRAIVSIETNIDDQHKFALYGVGENGYGRHVHIDVNHFDGYAKIRNKSIDLGIRYGYRMGVWGTVRFEYIRRLLAKSCPSQVNTWMVSFLIPFSL